MAEFIQPNERVIDFGCGQMSLKEYLPKECHYIGVDYKARSAETIVCDFNAYQFPEDGADVAFVSGCLEYIRDYEWFVKQLCRQSDKVIVSYCTMENFPDISERIGRTWVNHLTHDEIINLFAKNDFKISGKTDATDTIFYFVPSKSNI